MRFKMRFEGEDSPERRFSGTIIRMEDISPYWEDSKWRSLKVQWDEPASIPRPERVSPWEIEQFVPSVPAGLVQPLTTKQKRPRSHVQIPVPAAWNLPHGLEGQRVNYVNINSHLKRADAEESDESRSASAWSVLSSQSAPSSGKQQSSSPLSCRSERKSDNAVTCRLFGFDLKSPSSMPLHDNNNISQDGGELCFPSTMASLDSEHKSCVLNDNMEFKRGQMQVNVKEVQSRQIRTPRSRTKVQMQGVAVGRGVDLTILKGYDELITELEEMFEIKGELRPRNKWDIVFTDNEGDMMLMGDDPWPEFRNMVRRIFICSSQNVKKMEGTG